MERSESSEKMERIRKQMSDQSKWRGSGKKPEVTENKEMKR